MSHSLERIEQIELRPFAALAKELPSIMTAHVVFDALDPERPATLSRNVITGLLRQRLGFDGVIVSDDLEMRAIADHLDAGRAACDAIEAGCDALLVCSDPERLLIAHEALVRHAETEPAFAHRLRDAAERCLRMRREHVRHPAPTAIARELATITDAARRSLDDALASS